jgi:ligand-binding sensor domain-containing protein
MKKKKIIILFVLSIFLLLLFSISSHAKPPYRPGDWKSYTVLRYVNCIEKDFNYIYFGTTGGVSRYDFFADKWLDPLTESDGLLDNRVEKIAYDPQRNELYFKTYSGVCSYIPAFQEFYTETDFPYRLVHRDSSDFVFPSFFMDFGYSFYPEGYIADLNLNRYKVTDYLFDEWGNLWIGTWGLNAGLGSPRYLELKMFKTGLFNQDVKALLIDGDNLFFGGESFLQRENGISRYNRREGVWDYFVSTSIIELANQDITCMEKDSQYVWFGTSRGLLRYDKKKNRWKIYDSFKGLWDNDVTALKSDQGLLWIGTQSGLNLYLAKRDSVARIKDQSIKGAYIYSIEKDSNFVWIGTDRGAFQLNKKSGEVIPFNIPEGILNQEVKSIYKYQDELWFGIRDAVLSVDLVNRNRKIYQSPVNYPGIEVTKLVCDDKYLWVGTIMGAWRLDKQNNIWKGYYKEDGLLDNNIQTLLLDGDYIWFGTERGATRFYWNNPLRID